MLKIIIVFTLILTHLCANTTLKSTYYVNSNEIYISTLIEDVEKDTIIYKITPQKHIKRVKFKDIVKTLSNYGYKDINSKSRYIKFIKNSPIDTSKIILYLKKYYQQEYKKIDIININVRSRSYIDDLPEDYIINIRNKSYLSNKGIISISTSQNKKIFFNYTIEAKVPVYCAKQKIKKGTSLSAMNVRQKTLLLDRFMSKPIQNLERNIYESKHTIKRDSLILKRDIEGLSLIKINAIVNVFLNTKNMSISFSAIALKSGKINDIITLKKANGKKIVAKVIGKNIVEMQ